MLSTFPMHSLRTLVVAVASVLVLLPSPLHAQSGAPTAPTAAPATGSSMAPASQPATARAASTASPELRELVQLARERAPEVVLGRSALTASRSSYANARLAPLGNPLLEVKVQGATKDVVKDVNIESALWLPVEISGQKSRRGREADGFVELHMALLEQARASACARTVRAYGAL